eukprot:TRINITY_DN9766_c0_g1_i1.p1 TRINITY_DN9766_c0_g1~~TRINITY_DN9766_c0_g1_i1.p1  ORF type:complete len:453 (-),score=101.26 TRINITY_DN9766_c0_g1_i1:15-1373(-)
MGDKMELDSVEINSESSEKTEELSDGEWAAIEAAEKEAIEKFKDENNNNNKSNGNKRHPASLEEDHKKMSLVVEEPVEEEDNFFQTNNNELEMGVRTRQTTSAQTSGKNFLFYSGKIKSMPSGDYLDNIHKRWWFNYDLLEQFHGYIQWLFPVFESSGMNSMSAALSKHEAKLIREDFYAAVRVITSYRMMLNFYGMRLVDETTGEIERCPHIWQSRYKNLIEHSHNFLRINRILTSLGHLGFSRYKRPLVRHFEIEIEENGLLQACQRSLDKFWKQTLEVNSKEYYLKTKEAPEDRTESIFFHHLQNQTEMYKAYQKHWEIFTRNQAKDKEESDESESLSWRKYEERMKRANHDIALINNQHTTTKRNNNDNNNTNNSTNSNTNTKNNKSANDPKQRRLDDMFKNKSTKNNNDDDSDDESKPRSGRGRAANAKPPATGAKKSPRGRGRAKK